MKNQDIRTFMFFLKILKNHKNSSKNGFLRYQKGLSLFEYNHKRFISKKSILKIVATVV